MTQREYSNPIDLPFSSEETQRDDADSRSTVLMPGNLEVMTPEVAERIPSDGHRSFNIGIRRPAEDSTDTATRSFTAEFEITTELPCKTKRRRIASDGGESSLNQAAGYEQTSNGRPHHWMVNDNDLKMELIPGNVPDSSEKVYPKCVFKWAARYNSGRLTVLDNYIIVLDEDSPISLAVKTINQVPPNKGHSEKTSGPTIVYREPVTDEHYDPSYVFYYKYNGSHYAIRSDFANETLVVTEEKDIAAIKDHPVYQWKKVSV